MSIELEGTVVKVLPEQSGESAKGTWKKQEFVVETGGQYPRQVCFNCWGDRTSDVKGLSMGEKIKVSFEPSSREFNERWYTDLRAWKIEKLQGAQSGDAPPPPPAPEESAPPLPNEEDDLPF